MVHFLPLWLPILLSAVIVFVASSIIWMALPIHKKDYKEFPDETAIMNAVRQQNAGAGVFMFPFCQGGVAKDAAAGERLKQGPWGQMILAGKPPAMGPMLLLWFVHILIVSAFVAFLTGRGLPEGAEYMMVFRTAGIAAFLGYGGSVLPRFIWEGKPWSQLPVAAFDTLVYASLTAGSFAGFWPKAASLAIPG